MKKTIISLIIAGSLLFSGCSLITIQTDSTTAEPEKTTVSEETTAVETSAETTAETTKASETTAAETTAAPSETTAATTAVETTVPVVAEQKGKVVVLATGGTIAGVGDAGKSAGYTPGTLTAEDLISAVPELADVAEIEAIQVCNVNSDDITDKVWIELANKINELSKDKDITGFVITHGTDTMEETAYFLNLTVKTDKPVVITGSMRPSTSISADGPMNLYESVCVAASEEAKGKGVLVVFSDLIFTARSVTKTSTYDVMAISAGETGACGVVRDGAVYFYEESVKRHTAESEFDVSSLKELPKVSVIFFSVDMDPGILKYAAEHSDGIVIAGAGAGEFSEGFIEVVKDLKIPVVISSRIGDGIIISDNLLVEGTIAGDNLPPQKAAVLLRLALTKTKDAAKIQDMFFEY